ncbi:hypothetical protein A2814_02270 [Candidatus Nomurabacteria bacterium RIFCSPHIGHO2_01_FULL_38_19]|uniref:DUF218 domain-containing protein n=1 Tax=Candidatus Nomurabacteria bacterium RIFCSPHIGHO2_01_FULL_38_19 TaxID=1801732 RepID=A0A1F6UUR1_9BACT|nr:MAG: hypothetical protein A2814_02270 [Candidatus Nomurabacteria bacterium RIFCSPHIGHO2_01_FULL_38_19]
MSKLIVCLGYNLQSDNSVHPILENRLKDPARICIENDNSTLLLMGSSLYKNSEKHTISEASAMKEYLKNNFDQELKYTKILTEENTTSTVEQLCYLKKFIETKKLSYADLVIVSSQFFGDRVKLYAEYIFDVNEGITFVKSVVSEDFVEYFQKVEKDKPKQTQDWLNNHKKGKNQLILREQKEFQAKVKKGEVSQEVS